jgi:hypothetical protein
VPTTRPGRRSTSTGRRTCDRFARAPFRRALGLRGGERRARPREIEVGAVHGRSGLLAPRLVEAPRVRDIEAEIVDDLCDDGLRFGIVARDRKRDASGRPGGLSVLEQMQRLDVVERFDDGAAELTRDPGAFRGRLLDARERAVALLRIEFPVSITTTSAGTSAKRSCGRSGTFFCGIVTIATSPACAASATVAGCAPVSRARSASDSGPREFAIQTSYPSDVRRRASAPPMFPEPMIPIFMRRSFP